MLSDLRRHSRRAGCLDMLSFSVHWNDQRQADTIVLKLIRKVGDKTGRLLRSVERSCWLILSTVSGE